MQNTLTNVDCCAQTVTVAHGNPTRDTSSTDTDLNHFLQIYCQIYGDFTWKIYLCIGNVREENFIEGRMMAKIYFEEFIVTSCIDDSFSELRLFSN